MSYRNNLMARSSAYEEVWKKAREEQASYAKAEIASQYGKLGDYNNAFVNAMNEYDQAAKRLTEARIEKLNWESDYRNWQFNQWQNAETVWFNNLNAALDRYVQALNTELTMKQAEITKRRADTNARLANLNDSMADTLVAYHWYQQAGK
jgi:chromosome segregation ATPase